jgi:hypothetical protein
MFTSTRAFLPSQTMTQSPCRILSFCMRSSGSDPVFGDLV